MIASTRTLQNTIGPQCYRVCCSECSYMETVELSREHDEPGGPRSVAELPFSKVAEIMNISENSAKVLFFRAKNQIKEKLESEGLF